VKQVVTIISLIGSGIIILDSLQVPQALFMFLLAGIVPGTSIVLSGEQMLDFYLLIGGFIFARLISRLVALASERSPARQAA
jgi:hypothetical protein